MKSQFTFHISTDLSSPLAVVWKHVSTLQGVNDELMPILRMSAPKGQAQVPFIQAPCGKPLFASWLLLFGLLPFDRHQLQLDEVWEGGFRENSQSFVHRTWRHERILTDTATGCMLTDSLRFEPRISLFGYVLLPIVHSIFQHRHHRLRQRFGSPDSAVPVSMGEE